MSEKFKTIEVDSDRQVVARRIGHSEHARVLAVSGYHSGVPERDMIYTVLLAKVSIGSGAALGLEHQTEKHPVLGVIASDEVVDELSKGQLIEVARHALSGIAPIPEPIEKN
jgi:hypothetical protein